ncbi:MAG: hypothetical protein ACRCZI_08185, partial [Cetobacterium sp.]
MDLLQFHIGSTINFWDLPFEEYCSLAPEGWMKNTWEALSKTPLSLRGPNIGLPNEREHDVSLMDAFVAQQLDAKTLEKLNECRLYLGASHLSHISMACGKRIDPRCWKGKKHHADGRPSLIHTYRPTKKTWELWQKTLRTTFLNPTEQTLDLVNPLGLWLSNESPTWNWWSHNTTHTLYERTPEGTWQKWTRTTRRYRQQKFKDPVMADRETIPSNMIRASVSMSQNKARITIQSVGKAMDPTPRNRTPATLHERIQNLPESAKWALKHLQITDNGEAIARAIQRKEAIATCDGGLKFGLGTAAFVLEGPDHKGRIKGVNKTPGPIKDGDSL